MAKRSALLVLLLLLAGLVPSTAHAASIQDIIALSKAGVSDTVLLALIDRDKSVFAIEADELVALKNAGVSEAVVVAMLKSGREPVPLDPAPPAPSYPNFIIVGHGPDRPNTFHQFDGFSLPTISVVPYVVVGTGVVRGSGCVGVPTGSTKPVVAGSQLGRLTTDLGTRYLASGVGRIVNDAAVSAGSADATQASASIVGCQQPVPATRPRPRR